MGLMIKHELLHNQIFFLVALSFGYGLYVAEELIWQNIHCYFRMKYWRNWWHIWAPIYDKMVGILEHVIIVLSFNQIKNSTIFLATFKSKKTLLFVANVTMHRFCGKSIDISPLSLSPSLSLPLSLSPSLSLLLS